MPVIVSGLKKGLMCRLLNTLPIQVTDMAVLDVFYD